MDLVFSRRIGIGRFIAGGGMIADEILVKKQYKSLF